MSRENLAKNRKLSVLEYASFGGSENDGLRYQP